MVLLGAGNAGGGGLRGGAWPVLLQTKTFQFCLSSLAKVLRMAANEHHLNSMSNTLRLGRPQWACGNVRGGRGRKPATDADPLESIFEDLCFSTA